MGATKPLFWNLNWVVAANAGAGVANFLALGWFARALGPVTIGEYAIVVTAVQLGAAFFSAGFDQAIIRTPSDNDLRAAAVIAVAVQSLVIVAISVCAYVFYVLWAPEEIANRGEALALVLAALVLGLFANLLAAPIAARLEYRYLAIARLVSTGLGIGAGLGLTAYGFGELALAGRDACAALVLLLLCGWRSGPWAGCRANRQGITRLLHFTKGLWALNVSERMVLRLDYAIVGVLFEKDVLGTYFVVRGIVEGMLGFLVNPVQTVLFAHYCKGEAQGINAMLDHRRMVLLYMAACLGIAILAWLVGPAILDRFIGSDYGGAGVLLPPLVFYAGAVLWFENEKVLAMSRNQHHRVVYARLLQMAIYLALVGPATEYLGLLGAAIATAIAGGVLAMAARPASKMKHG